jgi:hypothetical protein
MVQIVHDVGWHGKRSSQQKMALFANGMDLI